LSGPPDMDASYNVTGAPARSITVTMDANVPPLVQLVTGDFQTQVVAPILATSGNGVGSLNRFGNPGCLYDCNGTLISVGGACCTDSSCTPSTCP
jgi:hypothetical protein